MSESRQILLGILTPLISVAIVLGALSISLAEGGTMLSPTKPTGIQPTVITFRAATPASRILTLSQSSATQIPNPLCPVPQDWVTHVVQSGDTLASIADRFEVAADQLERANCLLSPSLVLGDILYVPAPPPTITPTVTATPTPTSTATPPPSQPGETLPELPTPTAAPSCGPPAGWVTYVVQPGDTLFHLSSESGISVSQLQRANCMGGSTTLRTGSSIYVPHLPVHTPTRTPTPHPSATPRPNTPTPRPTYTPTKVNPLPDEPTPPEPPVP